MLSPMERIQGFDHLNNQLGRLNAMRTEVHNYGKHDIQVLEALNLQLQIVQKVLAPLIDDRNEQIEEARALARRQKVD